MQDILEKLELMNYKGKRFSTKKKIIKEKGNGKSNFCYIEPFKILTYWSFPPPAKQAM